MSFVSNMGWSIFVDVPKSQCRPLDLLKLVCIDHPAIDVLVGSRMYSGSRSGRWR